MPEKFPQLILALCYLLAWSLPLVHEFQVDRELGEHRLCMASYCQAVAEGEEVIHSGCRHQHHEHSHCAVCQQNHHSQQLAVHASLDDCCNEIQANRIPAAQTLPASRLFRHVIQPRAP